MCNLFGRVVLCGSRPPSTSRPVPRVVFTPVRRGARSCASALYVVAITLLAVSAPIVAAESGHVLELTEVLALASKDQPQLDALHLQEQSALEAARAERELPDPKLAFGVQNLPVTGTDSFRLDRDEMTMLSIGVMQDVVSRDKREASSARMTAEAERLAAEGEAGRREIRREAAFAWLDVFEAQQRALAFRKLAAEMTAERAVNAERVASGPDSTSSVLGLDTEISRLRDQLIIAQRDEARARAALSRWIGEHALRPVPEHLPHDLVAQADAKTAPEDALASHPTILSGERAIDVALREADRARAERRPDWGWQLMYGQRQELADMVSLQVTVGLPLNRADRQDRRLSEKLAAASAARSELFDRRRQLAAELTAARADLNASAARLREHQERLLPAARARLETAQAAYAGGRGALLEVWQARREMVDVSLHHEMILADGVRALRQLEWLVGAPEVAP